MSFIQQAGTAGNMQTYQTDLRNRQQAEMLANAINSLALRQGQDTYAGGGIAGNALLDALANQLPSGGTAAPSGPVSAPPVASAGGPPITGMAPGGSNIPPPPSSPQIQNTAMSGGTGAPPIAASNLLPPGSSPVGAPSPSGGGAPQITPQVQQQLTWKAIATAIKKQAPNATGQQVMAAIDKLSPIMTAQNKAEWDQFKTQMQTQLKEQGLQQQLEIAGMKDKTAQRGQDLRAQASGANVDPAAINWLAEQVKAGNASVLTRQPASVRLKVAAQLEEMGVSGEDAANAVIQFGGKQSEAKSGGRQLGQLDIAGGGFDAIAPDALKASAAVPRDSWKAAAQMGNWLREQSNDPDFVAFQNFNLGLVREYARAMGGTVAAQNKATEALGTAKDQAAYNAAVKSLQKEIHLAKQGGNKAMSGVKVGNDAADIEPDDVAPTGQGWSIKVKGQ